MKSSWEDSTDKDDQAKVFNKAEGNFQTQHPMYLPQQSQTTRRGGSQTT